MPIQSKIRSVPRKTTTNRSGADNESHRCCMCGVIKTKQKGYFPSSQSLLYKGNNGYLPICNDCIDGLYKHYLVVMEDEKTALRRVCSKFDIYWCDRVYDMLANTAVTSSRIRFYISKTNLLAFSGKTYDDSLDEENNIAEEISESIAEKAQEEADNAELEEFLEIAGINAENSSDEEIEKVKQKAIGFWGDGLPQGAYMFLTAHYDKWTDNLDKPLSLQDESAYKRICQLEYAIHQKTISGDSISQEAKALNDLIAATIQKDNQSDVAFGDKPFGVGIRIYENLKPIPEPDPDFQDVDGIMKYIKIWFFGHLCKMVGIKNTYSRLYDEEMERLRVTRPDLLDEEDDIPLFDDTMFGDNNEQQQ